MSLKASDAEVSYTLTDAQNVLLKNLLPSGDEVKTVPNVKSYGMKKHITVFHLPHDTSDDRKKAIMTIMTLCGRSPDQRPVAWQSWVISLTLLFYPELYDTLKADSSCVDYVHAPYPNTFIESSLTAIRALATATTTVDQYVTFPIELPNAVAVPLTRKLLRAGELENLYAYYAMVIFIFGKNATAENTVAFTTKRPEALIRKGQLQHAEYLLKGDGKVAPSNYTMVRSGFIRSDRPRYLIITHLAAMVVTNNRSELNDPVIVNMRLLKHASQSYLFFIAKLLSSMPWVLENATIRSEAVVYFAMANELTRQPIWLQPYYKLAVQDHSSVVARRGLPALIGCGATLEAQTSTTMHRYRIDPSISHILTWFIEAAEKHGTPLHAVKDQQTTESNAV